MVSTIADLKRFFFTFMYFISQNCTNTLSIIEKHASYITLI